MTLVTIVAGNGQPFLLADTLVSSSQKPKQINPIPTCSQPGLIDTNFNHYITGQKQKLQIIGDYIALGWAGNLTRARIAIREIKEHFGTKQVLPEEILSFLNDLVPELSINDESNDGISLLGLTIFEEKIYIFRWDTAYKQKSITDGPRERMIGTGNYDLQNLIQSSQVISSNNLPAMAAPMCVISALMNYELSGYHSLKNLFGGAFELIGVMDGKFAKLNDFTIFAYNVSFNEEFLKIDPPYLVLKNFYNGETLVISRLFYNENGKINEVGNQIHWEPERDAWFIESILNYKVGEEDISVNDDTSFNSTYQLHIFNFDQKNSLLLTLCTSGIENPINFIKLDDNTGIGLAINKNEMKKMEGRLMQIIKQASTRSG